MDNKSYEISKEIKKFIEKHGTYKPVNNLALLQERCDKLYADLRRLNWFEHNAVFNGITDMTELIFPEIHPVEDEISYYENRVANAEHAISFFTGEMREKLETMLNILIEKTDDNRKCGLKRNWSKESLAKVLTKEELELFKSFPSLNRETSPATEEICRKLTNEFLEAKHELDKAVELEYLPKKVELLEKAMIGALNKLKSQLAPIYDEWERERNIEWKRRKLEDEKHNEWLRSEDYKTWRRERDAANFTPGNPFLKRTYVYGYGPV